MNARSITNLIDTKQEQIEMVKKRKQACQTISNLKKAGFTYLEKDIQYTFERNTYKDILESGRILIYNGIVLAVSDKGIYIHPLIEIEDGIELKFEYFINFSVNQYDNIYSVINRLFNN